MPPSSLASTWRQQAVWSTTASTLKSQLARRRIAVLALVAATAGIETLAAQLPSLAPDTPGASRLLAGAGSIVLAVAGLLQGRWSSQPLVRNWTRARSASEGLKEQIYRYLTRTGAYDAEDPESVLRAAASRIERAVDDLQVVAATVGPSASDPPQVDDLQDYVRLRVEQQLDQYYEPRARELARSAKHWRWVQNALLLLGAILGGTVAWVSTPGLASWVAVITTLAGAVGAHVEASGFDRLVVGYQATASRLRALRDEWHDSLSQGALSAAERADFVDRCEDAISTENQAWMAAWTREGREARAEQG